VAAVLACASVPAVAQEHWTEGPVWECSSYRTNPGMFDTYMKYIRAHAIPVYEESKKAGLILDYKSFVKPPSSPDDWDFMLCTAHENYGRALDYSKADEDKADAIAAKALGDGRRGQAGATREPAPRDAQVPRHRVHPRSDAAAAGLRFFSRSVAAARPPPPRARRR
jgi:hypothetical protein